MLVIQRKTNKGSDDGPMTGVNFKVPIPDYQKWQGLRTTAERKIKAGELEETNYKMLSVVMRRAFYNLFPPVPPL